MPLPDSALTQLTEETSPADDTLFFAVINPATTKNPRKVNQQNLIVKKIKESGGQVLSLGAVADGKALIRSGSNLIGSGGLFVFDNSSNDFFRCDTSGASTFVGTINGAPSGATVTYNVTSGNENALVPTSTAHLAKMRLYNTTRGNYGLITNCNTTTNQITLTANAPANWVNGDVITIASQTVVSGLNHVDLEVTSSNAVNKAGIKLSGTLVDATSAGNPLRFHPFESYGAGKQQNITNQVVNIAISDSVDVKLNSNVISIAWGAGGASSATIVIRQVGYYT